MMLKIGITGGIGSGKTTVCRVFEVLGIPVFYADSAARTLMHADSILKSDIIRQFGEKSYTESGELNRKHISSIVFNNEDQLARLNALVHPAVFRAFELWGSRQQDAPYILKESALLFESKAYKMCSRSVLIKSPEALKVKRIVQRDHITPEEVLLRMSRQFTDERKEKLADHVVINDERSLLIPQLLQLHQQFLSLSNDH